MASKYTISVSATVTTDVTQSDLVTAIREAFAAIGTSTIVQGVSINQWIDPVNSKAQVFNDDGTPYVQTAENQSEE